MKMHHFRQSAVTKCREQHFHGTECPKFNTRPSEEGQTNLSPDFFCPVRKQATHRRSMAAAMTEAQLLWQQVFGSWLMCSRVLSMPFIPCSLCLLCSPGTPRMKRRGRTDLFTLTSHPGRLRLEAPRSTALGREPIPTACANPT